MTKTLLTAKKGGHRDVVVGQGDTFATSGNHHYLVYGVNDNPTLATPTAWFLRNNTTGTVHSLPSASSVWGVSDDGQYVLYTPYARSCCEAYRKPPVLLDISTGHSISAPVPPYGGDPHPYVFHAVLSGDAGEVVFEVSGPKNYSLVYAWNPSTNSVVEGPNDLGGLSNSGGEGLSISASGTKVAYSVRCGSSPESAPPSCVGIWDPSSGSSSVVSSLTKGLSSSISEVALSANGRYLVWDNYVNAPADSQSDSIYLEDLTTGATRLLLRQHDAHRSSHEPLGSSSVSNTGVAVFKHLGFPQTKMLLWRPGFTKPKDILDSHVYMLCGISSTTKDILYITDEKISRKDKGAHTFDIYAVKHF